MTIDRDYDQRFSVSIVNTDVVAHAVKLNVQNPYEDLILNFIGLGSVDETVTLLPGEAHVVQMAVHAQDANLRNYQLTAVVQSDEPGDPIRDTATLDIRVLFNADFTIEEVSRDPDTAAVTYRIENHGTTLTDLSIAAVDPETGDPAHVYIEPNISHGHLATDDSVEVTVYPLFGAEDVQDDPGEEQAIDAEIKLFAGGAVRKILAQLSCPLDKQIFDITLNNVCQSFRNGDWYCTNKDHITVDFELPYYAKEPNLSGARLGATFSPRTDIPQPHDVSMSFNSEPFASFVNEIPLGNFSWAIDPGWFKKGMGGTTTNTISIDTVHPNPGHYSIATDFTLDLAFDTLTVYQCASSRQEAESIVQSQVINNCVPRIDDVYVINIAPGPGTDVAPDEEGMITVKAYVGDNQDEYKNFYTVEAELTYLDVEGEPSEPVVMMDNGDPGRGDPYPGDRYFSGRWAPQYAGFIKMHVTATLLNGEQVSDTSYFTVEEVVDVAIIRVWQEVLSRIGREVEAFIEVKNVGTTTITQPMLLVVSYHKADDITMEPVDPLLYESRCQLLTSGSLDSQISLIVKDSSFTPDVVGSFHALAEIQVLDEADPAPPCELYPQGETP